jgi:hypothetical protein
MVSTAQVVSAMLTAQESERDDDDESVEDTESEIQGLSPVQIEVLAQKVYDLLLDELRIEEERYGRGGLR